MISEHYILYIAFVMHIIINSPLYIYIYIYIYYCYYYYTPSLKYLSSYFLNYYLLYL